MVIPVNPGDVTAEKRYAPGGRTRANRASASTLAVPRIDKIETASHVLKIFNCLA